MTLTEFLSFSGFVGRIYSGSVASAVGGWVESCGPCDCYRCNFSVEIERLAVLVRMSTGQTFRMTHVRPESLQAAAPL